MREYLVYSGTVESLGLLQCKMEYSIAMSEVGVIYIAVGRDSFCIYSRTFKCMPAKNILRLFCGEL